MGNVPGLAGITASSCPQYPRTVLVFQPGRFGLKSPFCGLCSLLAECDPGMGTAVGQLCPGAGLSWLSCSRLTFLCGLSCPCAWRCCQLCSLGCPPGQPLRQGQSHALPPGANPPAALCGWYFCFPVPSFPCWARRMPAGSALGSCQGVKAVITVPVSRPCRGCRLASVLLWGMNRSSC